MSRYPLWKYGLILVALVLGLVYTLPNFFGESPAVQISSTKSTFKLTPDFVDHIAKILDTANISAEQISFETLGNVASIRARFANIDLQFKAKTVLGQALNTQPADPAYLVSFNLMPNTPIWLQKLGGFPMFLGLDLRGGVHFLMQIDTRFALQKHLQGLETGVRNALREKSIRYKNVQREGNAVAVDFNDDAIRRQARDILQTQFLEVDFQEFSAPNVAGLRLSLQPAALTRMLEEGVAQNIATLSKRVNELGVAEPIIQRQGANRIIVQLPGVQDVGRAKDIIGRTATLEVRMVDDRVSRGTETTAIIPFGAELFQVGQGAPVVLNKMPVITGDLISNASAGFDENHQPAVNITLNGDGGRKMREATRTRIGKPMAVVLFEKGKGEVLTVATIQSELGGTFQITGMGSTQAANDLALLMRAGSLAAPMEIIEERTVGPQLGAENIKKGFYATLYGFFAVALFMIVYYHLFGAFSVLALSVNILLLVASLSLLQATLTLPGIAAIALTLGMAVDANVLINERIREELRKEQSPQTAIAKGFEHAWHTILDSNITTLIAGFALLIFGSGPIRGFAVVHCLGILTSMFSAVFFSRGLATLWYGRRRGLKTLSVG